MNFSLILFLFQFSVVMSDEDIEAFKRIFVMFDKVRDMFDKLNKNVLQGRVNPLNREMYSKESPGWRWDGFHQGAGSCPAFTRFFNLRSQLEEYKYDMISFIRKQSDTRRVG